MRRQSRGIALILVLSVLVLLLIITLTVSTRGIGTMSQVKGLACSYRSLNAAEAAVAIGLNGVVADRSYQGQFNNQKYLEDSLYSLEVTNNNLGGTTVLTASNGFQVKPGFIYLLGSGRRSDGAYQRQAGVLIRTGSGSSVPFALGAGGKISLRQHTTIKGGLKSSGDIDLRAQTDVMPLNGAGRLISGGDISTRGPTHMDPSQDARAAGRIGGNLRGTENIFENDSSADTQPFINDGRLTSELQPGEEGKTVLPYPDIRQLLEIDSYGVPGPNIVQHTETTFGGALDLSGQTHWYPNGITFSSSAEITGTGTVVVGNGNSARFDCTLGSTAGNPDEDDGSGGGTGIPALKMNVLALFPDPEFDGTPQLGTGNPDVRFERYVNLEGMVLAGRNVETARKARIKGQIIAYQGDIIGDMRNILSLFPEVVGRVPGLETFATGSASSGPGTAVTITSWQRF